jgi:uncharacterized membrane protein
MSQVEQPVQDERTMAVLAQVLQLVGWWIAPLIIFAIRRQSRFVSFHALQAILLQVAYTIVFGGAMLLFFATFLVSAAAGSRGDGPPVALLVTMPFMWLMMFGLGVIIWIFAIVYAIKAGRGEWAEYPLLGGLARKILKIGPGGTAA